MKFGLYTLLSIATTIETIGISIVDTLNFNDVGHIAKNKTVAMFWPIQCALTRLYSTFETGTEYAVNSSLTARSKLLVQLLF